MYYNNVLYYFRKNLQGDVTGIYNAYGTLVVEYEYTPYGAIFAITDANGVDISTNATHIANINPFRYRGYYYDTETELYYLITRYYDPVVGRFLNADAFASTGQGIVGNNMFAYCLNNVVNFVDSNGEFCIPIIIMPPNIIRDIDLKLSAPVPFEKTKGYRVIKRNRDNIIKYAEEYSVSPSAIAAVICAEQNLNVDFIDTLTDWIAIFGIDTSIGVGQVRLSTAKMLEDKGYVTKSTHKVRNWLVTPSLRNRLTVTRLMDEEQNIMYVAAYLKYMIDVWQKDFPDIHNRIDILATLYNTGKTQSHSNPFPNGFGMYANSYLYEIERLFD